MSDNAVIGLLEELHTEYLMQCAAKKIKIKKDLSDRVNAALSKAREAPCGCGYIEDQTIRCAAHR